MGHHEDLERQPLLTNGQNVSRNVSYSQAVTAPGHDLTATAVDVKTQESCDEGSCVDEPKLEWKTILAIASTWIGVFLASMDTSVLATLLGTISSQFGSFHMATYYINSYMIAVALVQPLSGKLSDIFGRKATLLVFNIIFLIGNAICGVADRDWHFVVGRAISGLGGGSLHSISTFLISDFIPLRSRGFWQGISNIAFGTGFAFGGVFGGLINDSIGWRWAFLLQPIPIVISIVMVMILLPNPVPSKIPSFKRIDFLGAITLAAGMLCLMVGMVSGGNTLPWSSPFVWVCFLAAPLFFIAFGFVEERFAAEPMIPVRLLKVRTILGSILTNGLCNMGFTALVFYVPLRLQISGMAASQAGLRLVPTSLGVFVGSLGAGIIMNATGKYYVLGMFCQSAMIFAAILVMTLLSPLLTSGLPFAAMLMTGSGFGGSLTVTLVALISAADHDFHASLTSASYAARAMGNVLGHAIAGAIFQDVFKAQLQRAFPDTPDARKQIANIRQNFTQIEDLPLAWRHDVMQSYEIAFHGVWIFVLATVVVGGLAFSFVRENKLARTIKRT